MRGATISQSEFGEISPYNAKLLFSKYILWSNNPVNTFWYKHFDCQFMTSHKTFPVSPTTTRNAKACRRGVVLTLTIRMGRIFKFGEKYGFINVRFYSSNSHGCG